jgi:mitotic spindle assembly checkpoint protein MAD2B
VDASDEFECHCQGHVDKAIVVIKNKEDQPLERFVFALRSMIEVQGYDRDHR